jgi:hypothetical protein
MTTKSSMLDALTDFANEHGDQALLELISEWNKEKMGKSTTDPIKLLLSIQHQIHQLDQGKSLDYTIAITDAMLIVLQELMKL